MDEILYERVDDDDFYDILGCSEHSTIEQINTEYKARVLDCHPDKHPNDSNAAERFSKLQRAKETLSDPEKRKFYDAWRNSGLIISYDKWCAQRSATHTSMHWASVKTQPMLQGDPPPQPSSSSTPDQEQYNMRNVHIYSNAPTVTWERDSPSEILRKFRNYEI
ncbi:hypothetical protein FSP39_015971 [Pinctada imbricata]|uniref:J domain-containing protein n=1 Tax=Pinctada imbricata TaxID=66713 RepID=A0AA88XZ82_PINIB|nr:hypothetical protein FSP39_015971 [Pinctada imbricata]